jgi:DNA adenine methylase
MKISICIPVYECHGFGVLFIQKLLYSISIQDYKNVEIIVSDQSKDSEIERFIFGLKIENLIYKRYSENWIPRAAQVIFLNKTCYNGLFRVNSQGEFNSPAGDYKNPQIFDQENLTNASRLLSRSEIFKADFKDFRPEDVEDSFIYFDPPFRPISRTANFTSYSKHKFKDIEQKQLARLYRNLDRRGAKLMLSNSDPKNIDPKDDFFDILYKNYYILRIPAKRVVNSDGTKRGEINEIIVTNYEVA